MAVNEPEKEGFEFLSFSRLTPALQEEVLGFAKACDQEAVTTTWPIEPKSLLLKRLELPDALARSKRFVDKVEPIGFPFLDENDAKYLEEELSFAFYLALADCELAMLEKRATLRSQYAYLLQVGSLLAQLRNRNVRESEAEADAKLAHDRDDPIRYFGLLFIAPKITAAVKAMSVDRLSHAVDYPASLNDGRLYLVWVTEMLNNICLLMRRSMRYMSFFLADTLLSGVSFVTGSMGWALYFLRGGVNTAFLFEMPHAVGLSDEEKQAYFYGKWHEKKFIVLNDALWGTVNCICFFILVGDGLLGYYGDVLNGVLFLYDFLLCAWQLSEAHTEHEALMLQYDQDIETLTEEIEALEAQLKQNASELSSNLLIRLKKRLQALKNDKEKVKRNWYYELKQIQLDLMYSGTVLLAIFVMCSFFTPPGMMIASSAFMLGLFGSIACFGLGIVHAGLSSHFQIVKTHEDAKHIEQDYLDYLKLFKNTSNTEENIKRKLFLDMCQTQAQTAYQAQLLQYQRADMICTIVADLFIPILFVAAFILMPLTLGASTFALGLLVLLAAKCYVAELAPEDVRDESIPLTMLTKLSGLFKPPAKTKPKADEDSQPLHLPGTFSEDAYQAFCRDIEQGVKADALRKHLLPKPTDNPSDQHDPDAVPAIT